MSSKSVTIHITVAVYSSVVPVDELSDPSSASNGTVIEKVISRN